MLDHVRKEYIRKADELELSSRPLSDIDCVPEIPRAGQCSMAIARFLREKDASNDQERMPTLPMLKVYSLLLLNLLNRVKYEVAESYRAIDDLYLRSQFTYHN